jgi:hypothetical protein
MPDEPKPDTSKREMVLLGPDFEARCVVFRPFKEVEEALELTPEDAFTLAHMLMGAALAILQMKPEQYRQKFAEDVAAAMAGKKAAN